MSRSCKGDGAKLTFSGGGGQYFHNFRDIDFWFFAKFIICGIFYHIKSQLGCDPLKGVIQGPPPENWFFENPGNVYEDRDF